MAKTPVVLRERSKKMTPAEMLEALNVQEDTIKQAKEMLVPLADITTFTAMLSEIQESRSGQTETLQSVMTALDNIATSFAKAAMDSASNSRQAISINTKDTAAAVVGGIAATIEATQEEIRLAIVNSEKTSKQLATAVTRIAAVVAENTKPAPLPVIEAEVTERDTSDRIKKFQMREVNGE